MGRRRVTLSPLLSAYVSTKAGKIDTKSTAKASESDVMEQLDILFSDARKREVSTIAGVVSKEKSEGRIKASLSAEITSVSSEGGSDWLAEERTRLGLPEAHKNALYIEATLTHTDVVINNKGQDFLETAEVEQALPTLLFQPVDCMYSYDWWYGKDTACFTEHSRERLGGDNGIRGVIYAARLNGTAVEVGIIIWARDFLDVADDIVDNQEFLGASYDIVASRAEESVGKRILRDITFFGCTILFKHKAGDSTSSIRNLSYLGVPLSPESGEDGGEEGKEDIIELVWTDDDLFSSKGGSELASVASAAGNDEGSNLMSQFKIEELPSDIQAKLAKFDELESRASNQATILETKETELATTKSELASVTAERDTLKDEVTTLSSRADAAEKELAEIKQAATEKELTEKRMGELREIGSFASAEAETETQASIGKMADDAFSLLKAEHKASVLERKIAEIESTAGKKGTEVTSQASAAAGGLGIANSGSDASDDKELASKDPRQFGRMIAKRTTVD